MSRRFSFTVSYRVSVAELHRALISDDMWHARFAGAETAALALSHPDGPGTIRVQMTERAQRDTLPAVVGAVVHSGMVVERTDDWGRLADDTAAGTFAAASTGITAEMSGTYLLRPAAQGADLVVAGTVAVKKVALVGGAIERLAEQLQRRVLTSERTFVENWLGARTDA